jgi:cardiolipin synthase
MFAVPGFLMGNSTMPGAAGFEALAWILGIPGLVLSYWTGIAYIPQVRRALAAKNTTSAEAVRAD